MGGHDRGAEHVAGRVGLTDLEQVVAAEAACARDDVSLAAPEVDSLQNDLDGRGRCLGTAGPDVAMMTCNKSPTQQWFVTRGELPGRRTRLGTRRTEDRTRPLARPP